MMTSQDQARYEAGRLKRAIRQLRSSQDVVRMVVTDRELDAILGELSDREKARVELLLKWPRGG